jgi:hypothetical protein
MSTQSRQVARIIEPQFVVEGAGVKLKRSMPLPVLDYLDPFLLFDHFGSDDPDDYMAGFPMHPHRGIETVTYMLTGVVNHKDSLGNAGSITAGDVQWMTSGRGILHEEMPQSSDGKMEGFQLWVNLPAKLKMGQPRYQEIPARTIPEIRRENGVTIRIIAGSVDGINGPVTEIAAQPTYLDVALPANAMFAHPIPLEHTALAYVFEGQGQFGVTDQDAGRKVTQPKLVAFGNGDEVRIVASAQPVRFLLVSGQPLNEPVARYGPFVMNTRAEIEQTLRELRNGTFIQT